ncbi:PREDICTED: uncharacterized protein LOC104811659 [Tarenaya hassleriana]|uniref:uncharacterized protein LOC104811659 n=1 Tax=Tarenaya hassleriana TaxID=28532 RepID=UPI00053C4853|nr:PREDICTED: uncharacterized protein LOC104811659 [Tarenaya hassleriana]
MNMEGEADERKHFSWVCSLRPPLLLIFVTLIPSTAFFFFLSSHGLTSSVLITITVLFISSSVVFRKLWKDKTRAACSAEESAHEENHKHQVRCYVSETTDPPSDTESSSEDLEIDWVSSNGLVWDVTSCFDDDGDDDGLIEIALTNDDGSNRLPSDDPKGNKELNLQKLWDEDGEEEEIINDEEENLIEIDISIGSIKKPTNG